MTSFEEQHSVWTEHHSQRWQEANGTSDMILVSGLSLDSARFLCSRLLMTQPDAVFWIKNIRNVEVARFSYREPVQSSDKPKRRALGNRT